MDGRKNNGGNKNAGRKSKAEEQRLIERLTPIMPSAYKALKNALKSEESWAVKLSFEYFFGRPKQTIEQNTTLNINDFDISKLYDTDPEKDME